MSTRSLFTAAERRAWRWPEKLRPSQWAERRRILPAAVSAEPGPFRFARTPYHRDMIDAVVEPGVEELVWVCATQVGKTTCQENLLGYWADCDPGPTLIIKPREPDIEAYIKERVRPLIESSLPHLRLPGRDNDTLASIRMASMSLYFGWSGSPASLAARPCRYALLDECDKFQPFAGREAEPVSLARERLKTFTRRKRLVLCSTPTTRNGTIWKAWEACQDKRFYHVPCLKCGAMQPLIFSQLKWPKSLVTDGPEAVESANKVKLERLAWYECGKCGYEIRDLHKPQMLERGSWVRSTDGPVVRVGHHLNSFYSPWVEWGEIASEFIRSSGDVGLTMNFRNSWLAEPFESISATSRPTVIREKAPLSESANQRPPWAVSVVTTADVQKDSFWFVTRAWGYGFKSHLLRYGQVRTFDELYTEAFAKPYAFAGVDRLGVSDLLAIDGKYRTNEVFAFARRDLARILITQGNPQPTGPMVQPKITENVRVLRINTLRSKDRLNELLSDPDQSRWLPHADIGEEYCSQLTAEMRLWDQQAGTYRWEPKYRGIANHLWDCEANQCAVATWQCLDVPVTEMKPPQPAPMRREDRRDERRESWIEKPQNWI